MEKIETVKTREHSCM